MEVKNGSKCIIIKNKITRVVGEKECLDCLFNNPTYNPRSGFQFCVIRQKGVKMKKWPLFLLDSRDMASFYVQDSNYVPLGMWYDRKWLWLFKRRNE